MIVPERSTISYPAVYIKSRFRSGIETDKEVPLAKKAVTLDIDTLKGGITTECLKGNEVLSLATWLAFIHATTKRRVFYTSSLISNGAQSILEEGRQQ